MDKKVSQNSILFHEYLPCLSLEDGHITDTESKGVSSERFISLDVNETTVSSSSSNLFGLERLFIALFDGEFKVPPS